MKWKRKNEIFLIDKLYMKNNKSSLKNNKNNNNNDDVSTCFSIKLKYEYMFVYMWKKLTLKAL